MGSRTREESPPPSEISTPVTATHREVATSAPHLSIVSSMPSVFARATGARSSLAAAVAANRNTEFRDTDAIMGDERHLLKRTLEDSNNTSLGDLFSRVRAWTARPLEPPPQEEENEEWEEKEQKLSPQYLPDDPNEKW